MGKLYELSDANLPDVYVEPHNFQQLHQRAKIWLDSLSSSSLSEIVKNNVHEALEESRVKNAQHSMLNPLQFDIKILKNITKEAENNGQSHLLEGLKNSAQIIFNDYANQGKTLMSITKNVLENFSNVIKSFTDQSSQLANFLDFRKPQDILRIVGSLENTLGDFRLNQSTINAIGSNLLDQVFSNVNQGFNFNASFVSKNLISDSSLEAVGQGIKLFTNFIGIQDPNTARQINLIGQSAVSIGQTLLNVGAIAAMSGPAAPFVAIGGTLISLLSGLFGNNGPSKEEQMLEAVNKQIQKLSEFIDNKFSELADHIDKRIGELAKHVDKRFDRLEGILNNFYKATMEQFFLVRRDIRYLDICIKQVNQKIEGLQLQIAEGFYEIYNQPYAKLANALEEHIRRPYPEYKLEEREAQKYYDKFTQWATTGAKNQLVAGKGKAIDAKALCAQVINSGSINKNINAIVGYGIENLEIKNPGTLINPDVWGKAARDLLTFIARTPELKLLPTYQRDIENIIDGGKQYRQFKLDLNQDQKLFYKLIYNYRVKLIQVCKIITDGVMIKIIDGHSGPFKINYPQNVLQITLYFYSEGINVGVGSTGSKMKGLGEQWQDIINNGKFDSALNDLEIAYQLLIIYIATAFKNDYLTNNWLREALSYLPVEKQTFQNYFLDPMYFFNAEKNSLLRYLTNIQSSGESHPYSHHIKLDQRDYYFVTPKQHGEIITIMLTDMLKSCAAATEKIASSNKEVENIIRELELFKRTLQISSKRLQEKNISFKAEMQPSKITEVKQASKIQPPLPYGQQPLLKIEKIHSISGKISSKDLVIDWNKKLGEGSYGVVYYGKYDNHEAAVKVLKNSNPSKEALEELQLEIKIMVGLKSPNIIQFYGCTNQSPYCIVMEYMNKGSLYQVLHGELSLNWTQRHGIILDVAYGLLYLHQFKPKAILHRDLKSLNVLLNNQLQAKLGDFGLAKFKTETRNTTTRDRGEVGTLAWMAPELLDMVPYTEKADMYSFGMVVWEVASREIPYKNAPNQYMIPLLAARGKQDEIPKECPPKIASLIRRCWETDPNKRPTAQEVVKELKDSSTEEKFSGLYKS